MSKVDELYNLLKDMGIKVSLLPYQRDYLEKLLNSDRPYIIMCKDHGRTYYKHLWELHCEMLNRGEKYGKGVN